MPASHIALQLPRTIFLMAFPQIYYTHNNPMVMQRSGCVKEMNTQIALLLHWVTITLWFSDSPLLASQSLEHQLQTLLMLPRPSPFLH